MAKDVNQLLEDLKKEQEAQQQAIQDAIRKEMGNSKITMANLDINLQNLIMASKSQSTGNAPIPKNPMDGTRKVDSNIIITDNLKKVVDDLLAKNNVYLWGKAGTGKTVLAKDVAKYLNLGRVITDENGKPVLDEKGEPKKQTHYILNCSQWTSPMQVIGGFSIDGYQRGQLEMAWEYGGVLILDELPKLDPNTAGLLNDALSMTADKGEIIVNGKGDRIKKHEDFMCIGAGNTNMKNVSVNFSGNNRQDYSLIDRFSGSIYQINENKLLEERLSYRAIYSLCDAIRDKLSPDSLEAITLRTMLNFGRIYQMEMLRKMQSPLAWYPVGTTEQQKEEGNYVGGKKLKDCVKSFIDELGETRKQTMTELARCKDIGNSSAQEYTINKFIEHITENKDAEFIEDFKRLTGVDPISGKAITKSEE